MFWRKKENASDRGYIKNTSHSYPNAGYYDAGTATPPSSVIGYIFTHGAQQVRGRSLEAKKGAAAVQTTISTQEVRDEVARLLKLDVERQGGEIGFVVRELSFFLEHDMPDIESSHYRSGSFNYRFFRPVQSLSELDVVGAGILADIYAHSGQILHDDMFIRVLLSLIWNGGNCSLDDSAFALDSNPKRDENRETIRDLAWRLTSGSLDGLADFKKSMGELVTAVNIYSGPADVSSLREKIIPHYSSFVL